MVCFSSFLISPLPLEVVGEIEDRIYEAALLITKSAMGIKASVRIYSTMHKAYGLMNKVVSEAAESGYRVYKWCIFCIMEKCIGRDCDTCELWEDCGGRARQADGFYPVEDAISAKRKVSREAWESEMLCRMPSQEEADLQGIRFIDPCYLASDMRNIHWNLIATSFSFRPGADRGKVDPAPRSDSDLRKNHHHTSGKATVS